MIEYEGGLESFRRLLEALAAADADGFVVDAQSSFDHLVWDLYGYATKLFVFPIDELLVLRIAFHGWIANDHGGVRGHVIVKGSFDERGRLIVEYPRGRVFRIGKATQEKDGADTIERLRGYVATTQADTMRQRGDYILEDYQRDAAALARDWRTILLPELEKERHGDR